MNKINTITLTTLHRGNNSTTFTGRPQGILVRDSLGLNDIDSDHNSYTFTIPEGTTSFNPSFFLGLFFDSIKKLGGYDRFKAKYDITILDKDEESIKILTENLEECKRQAINEYYGSTGLDF